MIDPQRVRFVWYLPDSSAHQFGGLVDGYIWDFLLFVDFNLFLLFVFSCNRVWFLLLVISRGTITST